MTATCPDDSVLRGLLDSSLPEPVQKEVVEHLGGCSGCQHKLDELAGDGTAVLAVAREMKADTPPAAGSAFWTALERVEQEVHGGPAALLATRAAPSVPLSVIPAASYPFLDPTDDPQFLGSIDRFRIDRLVGKGGMGMVFKAFDACLERTVAIKLLDPQYAKNDLARERFIREARAAARLTHENVVTIHHVECVESKDLSFIVMQFVQGQSLQDRLDADGRLPVREAVRIAAATAAGLASAHARTLIHRDVKPANILIEQETGRVVLTDFGLARLTEDVKLTQTGLVAGTPLYMSPEQARGETVDARSDLFSLGSVLYAMLTGSPPFNGSSPFTVLKQVSDVRHRPVQDRNPEVPDSLAEIVDRLLEKDPRKRYPDAGEVAAALNVELGKLPPTPAATQAGRRSSRTVPQYVRSWWRRNSPRLLAVSAAAAGLLLLSEAAGLTRWTLVGQRGRAPAVVEPDTPTRYSLPPGEGAVWAVAFDPRGDLMATATEGGTVTFWDAREGHIRGVLNNEKQRAAIWSLTFSKDGSRLVTAGEDGLVRLWDVRTKEPVGVNFQHGFPVRSAALSPDGTKLVSGTRNGAVIIWDVETGQRLHATAGHDGGTVHAVAFSPDGRLAASAGSDKTVKLWDVEHGSPRATLSGHTGPVYTVAFDPKGERLATAGWDHTIRVWDVNTTQPLRVIDVHKEDVWSLAFCPLGRCLVTGGQDRTVRWVDVQTGEEIRVFRGHRGPVHAVAVSPTDGLIAAGGRDGTVRVWEVYR